MFSRIVRCRSSVGQPATWEPRESCPVDTQMRFQSSVDCLPVSSDTDKICHDWLTACRFQMCKATKSRMLCCFTASRHAPRGHFDTYGLEHQDQLRLLAIFPHSFCPAPHLIRCLEVRIWARVHPICLGTIRIRAEM